MQIIFIFKCFVLVMQYLPAVINKPISPFHSVEVVDYIKAKDTYTFVRRVQPSVYIEHYAGEIINS